MLPGVPVLLSQKISWGPLTLGHLEFSGKKEAISFHVFNNILEGNRSMTGTVCKLLEKRETMVSERPGHRVTTQA